jgi:thiol-disulfide isomerase/thioredoxin
VRLEMVSFLALMVMLAGCDRQSDPAPQPAANTVSAKASTPTAGAEAFRVDRSQKGKAWPAFGFEAPNGDRVTLASFKGRPVLMNLWATWCAPCIKELPSIDALARREAERLQVLAISQDLEGRKAVDAWWSKQSFTLLQPYIDAEANFSFSLGGDGALPVTILYDATGKELWRVIGPADWAGDEAKQLLAEALK